MVLPYRDGSQSAMAPLALAAGVPVLTTRVGGLAEVVEDGVNGRLVAPGSAEALAQALAALDREGLAALAAGARRTASRLTWDGYAAALESLIERVVRGARLTPGRCAEPARRPAIDARPLIRGDMKNAHRSGGRGSDVWCRPLPGGDPGSAGRPARG